MFMSESERERESRKLSPYSVRMRLLATLTCIIVFSILAQLTTIGITHRLIGKSKNAFISQVFELALLYLISHLTNSDISPMRRKLVGRQTTRIFSSRLSK